ncbi:MAG: class I SAM-dependent methyltransferase [Gaiellaceae bacterium]
MKDVVSKYDAVAERYTATDYADPDRYYARRARAVVELGPRLSAGDTVLDYACGDGALGPHLAALGIDYRGVDASAGMVAVAARAVPGCVTLGDFDYTPPEPVDATTIFRSLYLAPDRRAFLAHLRGFTRKKLVFDFDPRAYEASDVFADVAAAGWTDVLVRPFLLPQRRRVPAPVASLLAAVEPLPGASLLTRLRFPLLVSARA